MNKPIEPPRPPSDEDIGTLLQAQNVSVPKDLDDLILNKARLAASEPGKAPDSQTSSGPVAWVGAAAVVMIAIGIAPLLIQSPDSEMSLAADPASGKIASSAPGQASEPPGSSLADTTNRFSASEAELSNISANADEAVADIQSKRSASTAITGGAAGDTLQEVASSNLGSADKTKPASVAAPQPVEDSSALTTSQSFEFRLSPESWIREIKRLETEDLYTAARQEYTLFRRQFPYYETPYRPQ